MKLFPFLLIFLSLHALSQPTPEAISGRLDALSSMQAHRSIPGLGFDLRRSSVRGTPYLTESWLQGGLLFAEDSAYVEKLPLRYNLLEQALEIMVGNGVKVAYSSDIKGFYLQDGPRQRHFITGTLLKDEGGAPLTGFYEVLQQGRYLHVRHSGAYVKKPDYNVAFHTGSMDYHILPTEKEYIADEGVLYPLAAFIAGRRKSDPEFRKFINRNRLSIKEDSDVASMLQYLNGGGS